MILAERAIIGTLMKDSYLIKETNLQPEHFEDTQHKAILQAMRELNEAGKGVDMISLISKLGAEAVGGANNLQEMQKLANPEKFDEYEEIVFSRWREKEKQNILHLAASENWEIEKVQKKLESLNVGTVSDHATLKELLLEGYESPWTEQTEIAGTTTGIKAIDNITGGLQDTDLIIVAARPSMGKTDIMLNWAREAGITEKHLVIIHSLEMPRNKLKDRLIASIAGIDRGKFKNPNRFFDDKDKTNWKPANEILSRANIHIFDASAQTVSEMRMKSRKLISENPGLKPIIFIDYLQIVKPSQDYNGNKNQQVGEISGGLKNMAKEFNCPVVCLSQLSRGVENRPDKRPMLSDLRDSGSIEQDADIIMFPYRGAYYTRNDDKDSTVEYIFAKHRNGDTGTILGEYDKTTGKFSGL